MRRLAFSTFSSLLLVLSLVSTSVANNDNKRSRGSLAGLEAIEVEIADVGDDLFNRGITEEVIFSEVNLQLRRAEIEMIDPDQPRAKPVAGDPVLLIEVLANVHDRYDQASFSIQVSVWQDIKLERHAKRKRGGHTFRVPTWSAGGIGESGTDWRDVLRDELAFYVDQFVGAWLAANPPSTQKSSP